MLDGSPYPRKDLTVEEILHWCAGGTLPANVPIENAIEAYQRRPNGLTLRTVQLARIPDRASAQLQFDCVSEARATDWLHRADCDHTADEIRDAVLASISRTIARMLDA